MHFRYDDGGRAEAGFKGTTGDCGIRAITIATRGDYKTVYEVLQHMQTAFNKKARRKLKPSHAYVRNGVWKEVADQYLTGLGWRWVPLATIGGDVVRVKDIAERWPYGRVVMRLARHFSAMVDGVNVDTWEQIPEKRVYGVWVK